jgi:hypothetical protein
MARAGRPPGAKNKLTASVKENIVAVFTRLGGTAAMAKWAEGNKTEFYRLYSRLAPTQLEATVEYVDARQLSDAELADIATGRSLGAAEAQGSAEEPSPVH